jgi:hypothetical protein
VSPDHRYATAEALALLTRDVVVDAELDDELGLTRIPADAVQIGNGLGPLLTLQAAEVVVYRLGDIARADAESVGRSARRWSKRLIPSLSRGGRVS